MPEYWFSARHACQHLLDKKGKSNVLPTQIPKAFRYLRPWVHQGWEMVLIAAELINTDSPLNKKGPLAFANNYSLYCKQALDQWGWSPEELQEAIEKIRKEAIQTNRENWLSLHQPFPGLVERLNRLSLERIDFVVLSTKGSAFTSELLNWLQLNPSHIYGHESGSKPHVLRQLIKDNDLHGFIEDRRATLETTIKHPELTSLRCYLASWGYLKPDDKRNLPQGIQLLEPEDLAHPLAMWP